MVVVRPIPKDAERHLSAGFSRLARRLGMRETITPETSIVYYRNPRHTIPVSRDEAYRVAASHAEALGLQGEPCGSSIQRMWWERYGPLLGMEASHLDGHQVWVVMVAGRIVWRGETYSYLVITLDMGGGVQSASFCATETLLRVRDSFRRSK